MSYDSLTAHIKALWNQAPALDRSSYVNASHESQSDAASLLNTAVASLRTNINGHPRWQISDVVRQLNIELIQGQDVEELLAAITALWMQPDRRNFKIINEHEGIWMEALSAARLYNEFSNAFFLDHKLFAQQEEAMVKALNALHGYGIHFTVRDGRVGTLTEYAEASKKLKTEIARAPSFFRNQFYELLESKYDKSEDYYMLGRFYASDPNALKAVSYPIGWMYQLVLASHESWNESIEEESDEAKGGAATAIEMIRNVATILNIEPYHWMGIAIPEASAANTVLSDGILFDNVYMLKQLSPEKTIMLLEGMFGWVRDHETDLDFDKILQVLRIIYQRADGSNSPIMFTLSDITFALKEASNEIEKVLGILSCPLDQVNSNFASPLYDPAVGDTLTSMFAPFIKKSDSYVLPNRLCVGPPAYEAIYAELRNRFASSDLEGHMGLAFERLVKKVLIDIGLKVSSGKYEAEAEDGECDVVVETAHYVIFLECKKKGFQRKTLGGSIDQVMFDVSGSIVSPHAQLAQHEVILTRDGVLNLTDAESGHGYVLEPKGRRIIKVAVTLLDLGILNDALVSVSVLAAVIGAHMDPSIKADARRKAIEEFNKNCEKLERCFAEMVSMNPEYSHSWRTSVMTWSLPFLMTIANGVNGEEEFERRLVQALHLTSSCGDRIQEFMLYERNRMASS